LSGPAGGIVGMARTAQLAGHNMVIGFDMGGTSTDVSHFAGQFEREFETQVAGVRMRAPMMSIHTVAAGGGSLLAYDGARFRVGPQSAGASPGPVCYGLGGTEPTVTDANLILGRLDPKNFLGGEMVLDKAGATAAMKEKIATPLGLSVTEAALGILRIGAAAMSHAVKGVTTDRGLDPGAFPNLFAYGGAGPLHASMVARELRIPTVIIPRAPGHFSAFGMLLADFRKDLVRSQFVSLASVTIQALDAWFQDMEQQALGALSAAELKTRKIVLQRSLDMRYVGQEHAVSVDIPTQIFEQQDIAGIKRLFDAMHQQRYGYCSETERAEVVSIRTSVSGEMPRPSLAELPQGDAQPAVTPSQRPVYFSPSQGWQDTPVYQRATLSSGNVILGPALIEEYASTTVIFPGDRLTVDRLGNLIIEVNNESY